MVFSQAETIHFGSMTIAGSLPFDCMSISSMTAAWTRCGSPLLSASDQPFTTGSAIMSALPPRISLIVPMPSEWSVITIQSSGRASFAGSPVFDLTSSPRANRKASSGVVMAPSMPASADQPVCTCVSPNQARSG